jgi:23S rRNA pseudouridine1911/1915/1917 synthase
MNTTYLNMGDLVCYKSNQFIAFNKPPGWAVQSKDKPDFHQLATHYANRHLFVLHRIDQPASGVVLFARNPKAAAMLSKQLQDGLVYREYLAIVQNKPKVDSGRLEHLLLKDGRKNKTFITPEETTKSKKAILEYQWLASSDRYHLLMIRLHTGRHHQIRAQLGAIGSPVKGDVKYGARRSNRDRSIHLHAWKMHFTHPVHAESVQVVAYPPYDPLWDYFVGRLDLNP